MRADSIYVEYYISIKQDAINQGQQIFFYEGLGWGKAWCCHGTEEGC